MSDKKTWEAFFDAHAPVYEENVVTKNTVRPAHRDRVTARQEHPMMAYSMNNYRQTRGHQWPLA